MSPAEVSRYLGVPLSTIYGWRTKGEGPIGFRVGRHVRYRREHVDEWLDEQADRRPSPAA